MRDPLVKVNQRTVKEKILLFLLLCFSPLSALTLKEKFSSAEEGDFALLKIRSHATLLMLRAKNDQEILLEEIALPASTIGKNRNWQEWLDSFAPEHTSWTLFTLHLNPTFSLDAYSYDSRGYLMQSEEEQLLPTLLDLPLQPTPKNKRRKIGSAPLGDEEDHRPFWSPPCTYQGKQQKTSVTPYLTRWPDDQSLIAGSELELYFASIPELFFPIWIEFHTPHYNAQIQLLDAGHGLTSPQPLPLKRDPRYLGPPLRQP